MLEIVMELRIISTENQIEIDQLQGKEFKLMYKELPYRKIAID